jgi:hypothetical protein
LAFSLTAETENHWNAGQFGEYHFELPETRDWLALLTYTIRFWTNNSIMVFGGCLGFLPWSKAMFWFGLVLILLSGLGLAFYFRSKHAITQGFVLFIIISAMTWILMVGLGITNFSPSRQTSVLAPIIAILAANGFCISVRKFFVLVGLFPYKDPLTFTVVGIIATLIISGHLLYYRYMRYEWSDTFIGTRQAVNTLVNSYPSPLLLNCKWTLNGSLLWQPIQPFHVLTFNRADDFKTFSLTDLPNGKDSLNKIARQRHFSDSGPKYCYVLASVPLNLAWRKAMIGWFQEQLLSPTYYTPTIVAKHEVLHQQYTEYVPISSLNPVGSYVWVVQLKP